MRYEEPQVTVTFPLSVLRKLEECVFREVSNAYAMRERGYRMNRRIVGENEKALSHVSEALMNYETEMIIGNSLSDNELLAEFPVQKKKGKRKK